MLICFDGLDKLGKSTQAKLLYEHLKCKGKKVKLFKQPDNSGDSFGKVLRHIIKDKSLQICPCAEWALHLASHANQWAFSIMPALQKDFIVILDRCWLSALAYQGYGRGLPINVIAAAESMARLGHHADHVFIFYSAMRNPLGSRIVYEKDDPMESSLTDEGFRLKISRAYFSLASSNNYDLIDVEQWKNRPEKLSKYIQGVLAI